MSFLRLIPLLSFVACTGCLKINITDIEARFDLADAAWFADEETLFFFYELTAEQGISDQSAIEVTYDTDDLELPWTAIADLTPVHTHVEVDCGYKRICGSTSLHVPLEPRYVNIRLRYHTAGEVFLGSDTIYNPIGSGPAHVNRSFLVYGVFTENNRRIQWRGRHRFPTLRNEQVTGLGLRRAFTVSDQRYGSAELNFETNPYGYALPCPSRFVETTLASVATEDRAVFNTADLTLDASEEAVVCARATVHEPHQPFVTSAIARKNPQVNVAFPVLRTPIHEATPIKFYLAPCNRTISADHDRMQRQRILYGDGPARCIDDWNKSTFVGELVVEFREAIERTRPAGEDMVLVIGLHRDEEGLPAKIEEALLEVLPIERNRSTPRTVGAFVFDSELYNIRDDLLKNLVLWCPAHLPEKEGGLPSASVSCAIAPDNESLTIGPFTFSGIPILPSRPRYLDFIDQYSEAQAGEVKSVTFLAPEFSTTTDNNDLGGPVATFFNEEILTADEDDAFSFCESETMQTFVFRSAMTQSPLLDCPEEGPVEGQLCLPEPQNFLPIENLPEWHEALKETTYELGLVWEFPFLLRVNYEVVAAASAGAFGLSVPFGFASDQTDNLGTELWLQDQFGLSNLLQCKRFCDHPTFDSAGIYNVTQIFRETYLNACYLPRFPALGDSSFPSDP